MKHIVKIFLILFLFFTSFCVGCVNASIDDVVSVPTITAEFIEEFRVAVKKVRLMLRTLEKGIKANDLDMIQSSQNMKKEVSELIFKARANQMQNVQCGKLSMDYDYLIFNLLADLDRIVEHCMNVSTLLLNK